MTRTPSVVAPARRLAGLMLGLLVAGKSNGPAPLSASQATPALPRPRAPKSHLWTRGGANPQGCVIWRRGPLTVLSSCSVMDLPDGSGEQGPTWLVSITRAGERASDREVRRMLRDFGMDGARADPARRVDCECKESETVVVEPDGYAWSNANEPEACRGCEHQRTMAALGKTAPCRFHGGAEC